MRLRSRVATEIDTRLAAILPEAAETLWDGGGAVTVIESLKYDPAAEALDGWAYAVSVSGVMAVELRADAIDALETEPLVADLVQRPIHLAPKAGAQEDELTEKARLTLVEIRDTIRDADVATRLRFNVSGWLLRKSAEPAQPVAYFSQAPEVGFGHEADYEPITELDLLS